MIIQFSTGGRGRDQEQRGSMLYLKPDMASLATGSVNFPTNIYENPPEFVDGLANSMLTYNVKPEIEVFDVAMLYNAINLIKRDLLMTPPHVQFVLGIPNALPARRQVLEFLIQEYKELVPNGTWTAAGIGRHQFEVAQWCLGTIGQLQIGDGRCRLQSMCHLVQVPYILVSEIPALVAVLATRWVYPKQTGHEAVSLTDHVLLN